MDYRNDTGSLEWVEESGVRFEVRFASDGGAYIRLYEPDHSEETGEITNPQWIYAEPSRDFNFFTYPLPLTRVLNPNALVQMLRWPTGPVQDHGIEIVGDARTTHVETSIDAARLMQEWEVSVPDDAGPPLDDFGLEAWIDEFGRVRRAALALPEAGERNAIQMTISFSKFGADVPPMPAPVSDD